MGNVLNLERFMRMPLVTPEGTLTRDGLAELRTVQRELGTTVLANEIPVTPAGGISATDVQAALEELDTDKADQAATAAALAGKQPLSTTLTTLASSTAAGLALMDDLSAAAQRVTLNVDVAGTAAAAVAAHEAAPDPHPQYAKDTDLAGYVAIGGNIGAATGTSLAVTGALTSSGGGIGYVTGAGGTVTQATSKATAVTLNKLAGEITMNNAALAAGAVVSFALNNSTIAAKDLMLLNIVSGATFGAYSVNPRITIGGVAGIDVKNVSAASLSEALVIRFAVIKAATA